MQSQVSIIGDDLLQIRFEVSPKAGLLLNIQALAENLREAGGWQEVVPSNWALCVQFDPSNEAPEAALQRLKQDLKMTPVTLKTTPASLEIPICYEADFAPDIGMLSQRLGVSATQIITAHLNSVIRVGFLGFTPGFAYCNGIPSFLDTARLAQPRKYVPAGSVGVAAGYCGIYALAGPGGWPLIGRTPMALFRPERENPFILQTGMEIRFYRIDHAQFMQLQAQANL